MSWTKKAELNDVLSKIILRITKLLERRGIIKRDEEDQLQINLEEDDALARLQAGAATYRFTMGPNAGKKALTLKTVPETDHNSQTGLVALSSGFSLHAGVAMAGNERDRIEKLCRYIARPAVALERLHLNHRGQVVYVLKKPYSDGTTHIMMSPLELLERLAAIVPRPRVHLTRFAGVFAPHYKHRAMVVPKPKAELCEPRADDQPSRSRISWARLPRRVFGIDIAACHLCHGRPVAPRKEPMTSSRTSQTSTRCDGKNQRSMQSYVCATSDSSKSLSKIQINLPKRPTHRQNQRRRGALDKPTALALADARPKTPY